MGPVVKEVDGVPGHSEGQDGTDQRVLNGPQQDRLTRGRHGLHLEIGASEACERALHGGDGRAQLRFVLDVQRHPA